MHTYIALLRGINVSGHKKIKMAELRVHLADAGLTDVSTYIQSGNILFTHEEPTASKVAEIIEKKIEEIYDFHVPVLLLKPETLEEVIANNPYEGCDINRLCVTFFYESPEQEGIDRLQGYSFPSEEYVLQEHLLYLHAPLGFARAKFSNNFFEQKLKIRATTRNWRTVNKLLALANEK